MFTPVVQAGSGSFWLPTFEQALEQARQNDQPILVHFYTDWCGPCQKMERTVFSARQFEDVLSDRVAAVKINADHSPQLARQYGVSQFPTDLFLDPNGRVLRNSVGMLSLSDYLGLTLQVESRYRQSRRLHLVRSESTKNGTSGIILPVIKLGKPGPFPAEWLMQTRKIERLAGDDLPLALDGYCPVRLFHDRNWFDGDPQYEFIYQEHRYHISGDEAFSQIKNFPERYVPQLLGCDPVIKWESDRAIPGSTNFAAFYQDKLYLFTSSENRELFQIDPPRYLQTRHVLRLRDIEPTVIR